MKECVNTGRYTSSGQMQGRRKEGKRKGRSDNRKEGMKGREV